MSHSELAIERHNAEQGANHMITNTEARKIASKWHGGGGTALYAFASTGAIDTARDDHDLLDEITSIKRVLDEDYTTGRGAEDEDIADLLEYVTRTNGPRGPVDGWSTLTW